MYRGLWKFDDSFHVFLIPEDAGWIVPRPKVPFRRSVARINRARRSTSVWSTKRLFCRATCGTRSVRMTPALEYRNSGFQIRATAAVDKPSKNGAEVWIPFKPEFLVLFKQYPVRGDFIVAPPYAGQWHEATLSHDIAKAVKDYGFEGFSLHGLRYNACQNLAEAGCTPHEIMSITGHKTVQMVEGYTKHFERRKSAVEAVRKLDDQNQSVSRNRRSVNAETTSEKSGGNAGVLVGAPGLEPGTS